MHSTVHDLSDYYKNTKKFTDIHVHVLTVQTNQQVVGQFDKSGNIIKLLVK